MNMQLCKDIQSVGMQGNDRERSWKHLNEQRKEGQLCDITFQCNGGDVSAHKCVLASVSDYFKVLFTSPISSASSTGIVVFDDFSIEVVALLMGILYSKVDIPSVHILELLRLADYIQLYWLVDMLVDSIRLYINETNIYDWYAAAKGFGFKKLKFLCECYVRENVVKFQKNEVKQYFDPNVFNGVDITDTDLGREVIIIHADKYYLIDPKFNSMEMLDDSTAAGTVGGHKLTNFWAEKGSLYTAFVHQNIAYLVTLGRESGLCGKPIYSISKFQHVSRSMDLVSELKESELSDKLINGGTNCVNSLCISQLLYDGKGSLYVMCSLRRSTSRDYPCDVCVFKLDVGSWLFYEGYVLLEDRQQTYRLANLNDHQICVITPEYVLSLDDHNFEVPGFHGRALLKIELSNLVVNDVSRNTDLPNYLVDQLEEWEDWRPVNKEGQFYCLVDDYDMSFPNCYNLLLRLDMDKRSWILCDACEFDGTPSQMLFHCNSTIYRHWVDQDSTSPATSYLDEVESMLKTVNFSPRTDYKDISGYVVIPYHLFL